jgi:non-homologous end joining protein Ku
MWSGTISLGLVSIPVTVGKSWADEREQNLRDICGTHLVPVDRTERCPDHPDCEIDKVKGVEVNGEWRAFNANEYAAIEEATKSDTLEILDVQKEWNLPMEYGTGTYYVRFNTKAKGVSPDAFAHLIATLNQRDEGCVVKWCRSARQKLAILHADGKGHLLLTTIPFTTEWREPDKMENIHHGVEINDEIVQQMGALMDALSSKQFDHSLYTDEGMKLRSDAVEKIVGGEKLQEKKEQKDEGQNVPDLMAQIKASMDQKKAA